MTEWNREELVEGLRRWVDGRPDAMVAVDLLIAHGTWIDALIDEDREESPNYVRKFVARNRLGTLVFARIYWRAWYEHLQSSGHTYGETAVKMFGVAASLAAGVPIDLQHALRSLDLEHARLVVDAVATTAHPKAWANTKALLTDADAQKSLTSWV
ncbi:hypothetical protein AB0A05_26935 [Streptomyces sp. NPDC046374]|uniref:hypothetical protein n=1 Tax=Streptomyces sp. NPDC046374 TaxID=3154917 RepID=UPI0033EC820C